MDDRNLILGVLAAQAGFVTPAQVMAAGSARILARDNRSILDHLVESGALTPERRDMVQVLADAALEASGGAHSWAVFPIPAPDMAAPAESLRRALDDGGFRLRGVELEVASP